MRGPERSGCSDHPGLGRPGLDRPRPERRVLLLALTARDAEAAGAVLSAAGVECDLCGGVGDLCREAAGGAGALVVPEEAVQGGRESPLCGLLAGQPVWSDLPVVLLSRGGSESPALAEATEVLGNVTVIERPVRVSTLLSVVRTALRARERQYQVRDHLAAQADAQESLRQSEARAREEGHVVETISFVGRTLAAELDVPKLVQAVTDATTEVTGAAFGAFFYNVSDEHGQSYSLYALSGAPREAFAAFPMPRNTELFGPTFRGEGVVRLADVTADPRYGRNAPSHGMPEEHLPVRSYLAVPVVGRAGEVLGGLFLGHGDVAVFDERDERTVVGIAAQAAVALDNARLFDAARRANAAKDQLLAGERSAREEAERANRLKDEFLAVVSHELRTPLNAILGWSQLLRQGAVAGRVDPDDLKEGVEAIDRNARAQTQIIEDLLDMGRILSGKVRLDVQQVDLPAVIGAAMESMQPAADARGVRLQKVLDPLPGPVSGDPARLQQVVWNLVSNAIKFTPRGGRVCVTLARAASHVRIDVTDSGEGIAADFLPYVFERFRQAEGSTTRRHGGLGLGLSIVKNLVELHGGTVAAESDGKGRGATFRVCLPLIPLRTEPAPAAAEPRRHRRAPASNDGAADGCADVTAVGSSPRPSLQGLRVLVVDDEPDARSLLQRFLRDCGAQVTAVASADEALAALHAALDAASAGGWDGSHAPGGRGPGAGGGAFHVIVSDVGMPDHDGYDLARALRALPPERGGRTPAVALTAFARSEDRTRAMLAGFDLHMAKPVEQAELCAAIFRLAARAARATGAASGRADQTAR